MTTATEIFSEALGKLGLVAAGEAVNGNDGALMLLILNTLIDAWNLPSNFAYTTQDVTATLGTGVASLSIGPAQALNCTRPGRIELGSCARLNGVDYELRSISEAEYNEIPYKANQGIPAVFYYDPGATTGTVYYYPVAALSFAVHHPVQTQTTAFADLIRLVRDLVVLGFTD